MSRERIMLPDGLPKARTDREKLFATAERLIEPTGTAASNSLPIWVPSSSPEIEP
ncbi:hypothetical protein [Mesorhizobium sp. SP-1A]|uniref:hypothetical protein n=1 Tax=Mesorhizobium sp. SP-1A TaxID=3077840 RepID=UPI0028F70E3F|nr:hypothetical protein [Mesorhizobium sp. SP-1A]